METFQSLIKDATFVGLYTKPAPVKQNIGNKEELALCEELALLPLWCFNDTLHIDNTDYRDNGCCLTHRVGLPKSSATGEEMPLTPYQVEFCSYIINDTEFTPTNKENEKEERLEFLRQFHLYHINKGRQMGFTEIVLRLIQYFCFSRYAGHKVAIQAGNTGKLANKDLRRFTNLFATIPSVIEHKIKSTREGVCVKLVNNTTIWAYPASEEAITGDTNYKCVFMDEAAKWIMIEDQPVFNSILPIVKSNGADLFLVSTPKGPLKTFYDLHVEPGLFTKLKYDVWRAEGNLFTKSVIQKMLLDKSGEDPEQEYLCKFKTLKDSVFKTVTDEDKQGKVEWAVPDEDEEDDNYIETYSKADLYEAS